MHLGREKYNSCRCLCCLTVRKLVLILVLWVRLSCIKVEAAVITEFTEVLEEKEDLVQKEKEEDENSYSVGT